MRCFLEDLPKDTLVVGAPPPSFPVLTSGNFKAEEWNSESGAYLINPQIGIKITVDVYLKLKRVNGRKSSIMIIE